MSVYILDSKLQSGLGEIPKLEPRSRLGIYVGHSPVHAGNVALVLNPRTGLVSPQYHVVFDNIFSTVPFMRSASVPPNWKTLVETSTKLATDEYFDLAKMWTLTDSFENNDVNETATDTPDNNLVDSLVSEGDIAPNNTSLGERRSPDIGMPTMINLDTAGLRRSPRTLSQYERPKRMTFFTMICLVTNVVATNASVIKNTSSYATRALIYMEEVHINFDGTPNFTHRFFFATSLADNESYILKEALK